MNKTKYKGKFAMRIYRGKRDDDYKLDHYRIDTYLKCSMELCDILGIGQFLTFIPIQQDDNCFWTDEFDFGDFNVKHNRSWYDVSVEEYIHNTIMARNSAYLCVKNKFDQEEDVLAVHDDECQYDTGGGSFWRYILTHDKGNNNDLYSDLSLAEYSSTPVINMEFSKQMTMRKLIMNSLGRKALHELSDIIIIFDDVNFEEYFKNKVKDDL